MIITTAITTSIEKTISITAAPPIRDKINTLTDIVEVAMVQSEQLLVAPAVPFSGMS